MKGFEAWLNHHHMRFRMLGVCAFLLTLLGYSYSPVLHGPFFFDDEHFLVKNSYVHSLDQIPKIFTSSVTEGAGFKGNFYRPLQQTVFAMIYRIYKAEATWPYHLSSLLLHALNGILILILSLRMGLSRDAGLLAMAVFLLHPVQTQAVSYISGLSDPLCFFFILLGLVVYAGALSSTKWSWTKGLLLPLMCMGMALLAKESGVVFPAMALAIGFYRWHERGRPRNISYVLPLVAFAVLAANYLLLKFTVLKFSEGFGLSSDTNVYTGSLLVRLTSFLSVLWDYAVLVVYPKTLFYERPYQAYTDLWTARGVFGLALVILAASSLLSYRRWPHAALAVWLTIGASVPYIGIVPLNAIFLEHWLYGPMLGLSLLLASIFMQIKPAWARAFVLCSAVILLGFASQRTAQRAGEWADIEKFYLNEIAASGGSVRMFNNLGMYYADLKDDAKAIKYYNSAIQKDTAKTFPQPPYNLARIYLAKNDLPQGFLLLQDSLSRDHRFGQSLELTRQIFSQLGDGEREMKTARALQDLLTQGDYDYQSYRSQVFDSLLQAH